LVVLPVADIVTVSRLEHLQAPSSASLTATSTTTTTTADNTHNDNQDNTNLRRTVGIAGDTVDLTFTDIDIMRLSVGNILSLPQARPPVTKVAKARVMVMDQLTIPIIRGAQVMFHMHNLDIPAVLTKLIAILKTDGVSIKKERPRAITGGVTAIVELTLSDRIVMESYAKCRALGRFVLRRGGDTIAIGIIDEPLLEQHKNVGT
jgi:translation elongation factor EF-1alpha